MNRWTRVALAVVVVAGAVTAWHSYRLQTHHLSGLPAPTAEPIILGLSAVPTVLLLAAGFARRRSPGMQGAVAVAAALVAALRVAVIRTELSAEWTHGTGLISAAAWVVGVAVAVVVLAVAVVAAVCEAGRGPRRPVGHAEPAGGDTSRLP